MDPGARRVGFLCSCLGNGRGMADGRVTCHGCGERQGRAGRERSAATLMSTQVGRQRKQAATARDRDKVVCRTPALASSGEQDRGIGNATRDPRSLRQSTGVRLATVAQRRQAFLRSPRTGPLYAALQLMRRHARCAGEGVVQWLRGAALPPGRPELTGTRCVAVNSSSAGPVVVRRCRGGS